MLSGQIVCGAMTKLLAQLTACQMIPLTEGTGPGSLKFELVEASGRPHSEHWKRLGTLGAPYI